MTRSNVSSDWLNNEDMRLKNSLKHWPVKVMAALIKSPRARTLVGMLAMWGTVYPTQGGTTFPVATNPAVVEISGGIAFSGSNYLVALASGTSCVGQMVTTNGALSGSQIAIGSNLGLPPTVVVAFCKSNYLVAWTDTSISSGVSMFGQRISGSGAKVGGKTNLLASAGSYGQQTVRALASDGTNYLLVWQDNNSANLYGQLITSAGARSGSEFLISNQGGNGNGSTAIAFGTTNYLVVWQSNDSWPGGNHNNTFGNFVTPDGSPQGVFQIGQTPSSDNNPLGVAFDGANFLVAWNVDNWSGSGAVTNWDIYARVVSPDANLPGDELILVNDPGSQVFPTLAFDGANFLMSWGDGPLNNNSSNAMIRFRFFDRSANPIGAPFTVFSKVGTNSPLLTFNGLLFDHTRYVAAGTLGVILTDTNGSLTGIPSADVYGAFIGRLPTVLFTANPTNGIAPLPVQFNCPSTDSLGSNIVSWSWSFGDGGSSAAQNPSHTYTNGGTFSPSLIATNNTGSIVNGIGPAITVVNPPSQTFAAVYSFTNFNDGFTPYAGLILSGITLYGTASYGGDNGIGAVFKINTDGSGYANIYSFSPLLGSDATNNDGAFPQASLVLSNNTLYGTASAGGTNGSGGIFRVNVDGGGFTNLHSFALSRTNSFGDYTNKNGAHPFAGLVLAGSCLYGTTVDGSTNGNGTVFRINTDGSGFTNLYIITARDRTTLTNTDGANPHGGLVVSGNTLYGTTFQGGTNGFGTVFAVSTNGTGFTSLHHFNGISDGDGPTASLLLSGNTLFGTTAFGGSNQYGTVFSITTNGTAFTNLYTFSTAVWDGTAYFTNSDGAEPYAGLVMLSNTLYGVTETAGYAGNGTVFAIKTNGANFTTMYSFTPLDSTYHAYNSDGSSPQGTLTIFGNNLYGTAPYGGVNGNGTVFSLPLSSVVVNPPRLTITRSGQNVILTWASNASNFTLQSTTNLVSPVVWITNSPAPVIVNGQNTVTNPITGKQQFYRLSQ